MSQRDRRPLDDTGIILLAKEAWTAAPATGNDWSPFISWLLVERVGVRNGKRAMTWARLHLQTLNGDRDLQHVGSPEYSAVPDGMSPVGYLCVYCGAPAEAIDHVWPKARGGDDHPNNLVRSCRSCNSAKSASSLLTDMCPGCGYGRDPGDVDTATGIAFYACRCDTTWTLRWDLQHMRLN